MVRTPDLTHNRHRGGGQSRHPAAVWTEKEFPMWYAYYRLADDHQAALRAERDRQYLAEQVHPPRPSGLRAGLRSLARLLDARHAGFPQPTGTPVSGSPSPAPTG